MTKKKLIKAFYNQENLGYMKNFQRAISYCSGDYLVFCDQDDIWLPDKIAIQLDHLRASNALAFLAMPFWWTHMGRI